MTKPLRSRRWFDNPDNDDRHDKRGQVNRNTVIRPRAPRMPVRRGLPQLFFRHAQPNSLDREAQTLLQLDDVDQEPVLAFDGTAFPNQNTNFRPI